MRSLHLCPLLLAAALWAAAPCRGQSLLENGNFDNPGDPLKGWLIDYAWEGNSNYVGNKDHVSAATEGGRKAAKMDSPGEGGVKMETRAFPLEPGFRYICNLDAKGGGYRIYFAGYRWAPGVRPHENPELGELRMIYKSKATTGTSEAWKPEKIEIPGVKLSPQAIENLKQVRFLTVYIWMVKTGFVSNVKLTKIPDPAMKF